MNQNLLRLQFLQQAQISLVAVISKFTTARNDSSFVRYLSLLSGLVDYVTYLNYLQVARGDETQDREVIIVLIKGVFNFLRGGKSDKRRVDEYLTLRTSIPLRLYPLFFSLKPNSQKRSGIGKSFALREKDLG